MKIKIIQEITVEFKDNYDESIALSEAVENGSVEIAAVNVKVFDEDGNELDKYDDNDSTIIVNGIRNTIMAMY